MHAGDRWRHTTPDMLPHGEHIRLDQWRRARMDGSMPDVEWLTKAAAFDQVAETENDNLRNWLLAL
jgi:hypothetical protein